MVRLVKRVAALACAALALVALAPNAGLAADKLKIVASFSILGDMARAVAGDHASVDVIVGPNADAHVYSPNVADARAVAEADVVFTNGLGFETWSQTLIETSGGEAAVFVATAGVEPLLVEGAVDPHAWNALSNGVIYVRNIADALASVDPTNADAYRANAAAYTAELRALHEEALARIAALPEDRRTVVTAHDAFGYLARAYGLTFRAPLGVDTEAEPSARELAALIRSLKETGAAALFVENITSPALVQQIADETGLRIGGRIFSDALSGEDGPAPSYLAMFRHNLEALIAALEGGD